MYLLAPSGRINLHTGSGTSPEPPMQFIVIGSVAALLALARAMVCALHLLDSQVVNDSCGKKTHGKI